MSISIKTRNVSFYDETSIAYRISNRCNNCFQKSILIAAKCRQVASIETDPDPEIRFREWSYLALASPRASTDVRTCAASIDATQGDFFDPHPVTTCATTIACDTDDRATASTLLPHSMDMLRGPPYGSCLPTPIGEHSNSTKIVDAIIGLQCSLIPRCTRTRLQHSPCVYRTTFSICSRGAIEVPSS
jgi:hypothetical protein